jgi:molybdenum cofactor synthesis domain-containing protein
MSQVLTVKSLNISENKGTKKTPVLEIELNELGLVGDSHAGSWHRQVSLLGLESYERFVEQVGRMLDPGDFAENITTEGVELKDTKILDRFVSDSLELEVTQIGKKCHFGCEIIKEAGACIMPKEGIFCRVVKGGVLKPGHQFDYVPHSINIRIITLSDRASAGEYEDLSGPEIETLLAAGFETTHWRVTCGRVLIPDDPEQLKQQIELATEQGIDVLFTTGGTGIGPRDITPDVVGPMLDREIPGVMEFIRMKHGERLPSALLSRSVAGTIGNSRIYTLPGSVKAVREYTEEILRTLPHSLLMLHGINSH